MLETDAIPDYTILQASEGFWFQSYLCKKIMQLLLNWMLEGPVAISSSFRTWKSTTVSSLLLHIPDFCADKNGSFDHQFFTLGYKNAEQHCWVNAHFCVSALSSEGYIHVQTWALMLTQSVQVNNGQTYVSGVTHTLHPWGTLNTGWLSLSRTISDHLIKPCNYKVWNGLYSILQVSPLVSRTENMGQFLQIAKIHHTSCFSILPILLVHRHLLCCKSLSNVPAPLTNRKKQATNPPLPTPNHVGQD